MSSKLSVEEVLSNLERRAVFHREQEALHARQAVHHQEQQELHGAELAKVLESLEAFRAVATSAVDRLLSGWAQYFSFGFTGQPMMPSMASAGKGSTFPMSAAQASRQREPAALGTPRSMERWEWSTRLPRRPVHALS